MGGRLLAPFHSPPPQLETGEREREREREKMSSRNKGKSKINVPRAPLPIIRMDDTLADHLPSETDPDLIAITGVYNQLSVDQVQINCIVFANAVLVAHPTILLKALFWYLYWSL